MLAFVAGVFGANMACSAPPAQKTPILVCEAGEDGCPSERPITAKPPSKKSDDDDGPSGTPAPAPSSTDEDEQVEPEPEPEPPLGAICTKLKGCCDQLKAAGYSDATCLEIVDTKSENACSLQHKQYKDFGDCT